MHTHTKEEDINALTHTTKELLPCTLFPKSVLYIYNLKFKM